MRDMFLLGAGASAEAGVPMAYEMTKDLLQYFENRKNIDAMHYCSNKLIQSVVSILAKSSAYNHNHSDRDNPKINVEDVISTLDALNKRHSSYLALFSDFKPIYRSYTLPSCLQPTPPKKAADSKEFRPLLDPDKTSWSDEILIDCLDLVWGYLDSTMWLEPDTVNYLLPLICRAQSQKIACIVTLNYDNSIETLCPSNKLHDGMQDYAITGRFRISQEKMNLLKLHGSITWEHYNSWWVENQVFQERVMPIRRKPSAKEVSYDDPPQLIFGSAEKLRATGPYLPLLFAFRQELMNVGRLFVVGYSFHDEHINEQIRAWINGNERNIQIIIIDPGFPETQSNNPLDMQNSLLELKRFSSDSVHIIRKKTSQALKLLEDANWNLTKILGD